MREFSPTRIAALPYFYLDCGTEDIVLADNIQFVELLRAKKISHEFRELPGDHSWQYWDRQVQEVLKIAAEKMHASKGLGGRVLGVGTGKSFKRQAIRRFDNRHSTSKTLYPSLYLITN